MSVSTNGCIVRSLELARELREVSEEGQCVCDDDGCSVLFGIVRDCAYTIMKAAQREREAHRKTGRWGE